MLSLAKATTPQQLHSEEGECRTALSLATAEGALQGQPLRDR